MPVSIWHEEEKISHHSGELQKRKYPTKEHQLTWLTTIAFLGLIFIVSSPTAFKKCRWKVFLSFPCGHSFWPVRLCCHIWASGLHLALLVCSVVVPQVSEEDALFRSSDLFCIYEFWQCCWFCLPHRTSFYSLRQ